MATKKQLNKKIQQLEIKLHTKKYIHIPMPSWKGIGKLCLALFTAFLSVINFIWLLQNITIFDYNYAPKFADLIVLYPLLGQFVLIGLTIILAVSLFKELKSYDEEGLISGLIFGLISGLIIGLIYGLIVGLIVGLIYGLIVGLIVGLIYGLIVGLIFGLIIGLIYGLIEEFN